MPSSRERSRPWRIAGGALGLTVVGTATLVAASALHDVRELAGLGDAGRIAGGILWIGLLLWAPAVGTWLLAMLALSLRALRAPGPSSLVVGILAAVPAFPLAWVSIEDAEIEPAAIACLLVTTAAVNVIAWRRSAAAARLGTDGPD